MKIHPSIRAVFFLALIASTAIAQALSPIFTELSLPPSLDNRPIWVISRLSDGLLAIGYEGGFAVGSPDATWKTYDAPNGQVVKVISQSKVGILIAGEGFCGYLAQDQLVMYPAMSGDYISAEALDDGWLVASRSEIWRVHSTASSSWSTFPTHITGQVRLTRLEGNIIASHRNGPVQHWTESGFQSFAPLAALNNSEIGWADGDLFVTERGIVSTSGEIILDPTANRSELRAGIVGVATFGPLVVVATFGEGISIYERNSRKLVRKRSGEFGNIYWFARDREGLLLGTSQGAMAVADPSRFEFVSIGNEPIFELVLGEESRADIITASGSMTVTDSRMEKFGSEWPANAAGVSIQNSTITDGTQIHALPSRFIYGLASVQGTTAAVTDRNLMIFRGGTALNPVPLEGVIRGLATDGRNYLISTTTQGVHVVSPQGQMRGRIGSGRASVSEVRPGKVALLFWDGTILDSDANSIGRASSGNPRDAALVDGRLAVLVTRTDRDPVVGLVEGDTWKPLEVPGLGQIGAEQIASNDEYFFAAGPRGVIRVRLPLLPSAPPSSNWRWSGQVRGSHITLPHPSDEFVEITPLPGDFGSTVTTSFQIHVNKGGATEILPGRTIRIPVTWGRTPITIREERNSLLVERQFTVIRPWPWWLRPWAWPIHFGLSAGLVIGVARLRTRRLERLNRELERHVALRTTELRKANAAKEEFLAGISHEIRNPLNGVVGICAMLADREVGPREKILVRTLGGCADQLRSMLDDILDFSRIERGDIAISNQDFELSSLVEESAMVMDPERHACTLILPDHPIWLHGDSGKLRQIACNLISNALKYGVPREAGIDVRAESTGSGRSRVRIAVRNSGPNLPAEEIPRLFESFQRGSRTGGIPGSGLGLAVCRRLIQAMGGRITAASVDGVTEFAVEVALANARPPEQATELPAMVSRALAIEDEDYNRMALGHVLRALGYQVDWAADGTAALKLAAERPYDLVLTDWRLPDMNGGDLCRRLLSLLANPKPPVIAVTAYSTAEKLDEARAAGMTGFVTKPVTKEKLARVIRGLSVGLQPRRSLDINLPPPASSPLVSLGDLAPSCEQLSIGITEKWRSTMTLAELHDPRTPREAHALRSLLLLASEEVAAEQLALIEDAAESGDWATVEKLIPFAAEEISQTRQRLNA